MFLKTTSINFQKYGITYSELTTKKAHSGNTFIWDLTNKKIDTLYKAKEDLYIRVHDGIVLLLVSDSINVNPIKEFVMHQIVKINKDVYYNFISISNSSSIEVSTSQMFSDERFDLDKPYIYKAIKSDVRVNEILSYYYVVRGTNYVFPGEAHQYWELTMIDNGCLHTDIEGIEFKLHANDLILYAPRQFHTQYTNSNETCSYLTIVFDMEIQNTKDITMKVFNSTRDLRHNIEEFIKNSSRSNPFTDDALIVNLQRIIVSLLQKDYILSQPLANTPMQQKFESELLDGILNYINENIYTPLTIEELCDKFSISRSSLQVLFKNNLNTAPKQYISNLKLNRSKQLIKESKYTISEIAGICGFASIHYFSRKFKQEFGITPTDYAKSFYE